MLGQEKFKWTLNDVLNVFVMAFIIELILFMLLQLFGVGDWIKSLSPAYGLKSLFIFLVYIAQVAAMIFPLWFLAVRKRDVKLYNFGFRWIGTGKTILWVICAYVFYLGLGTLFIILFYNFGLGSLGFEPQSNIFDLFGREPLGVIIAFVIALIIAPLTEELFFRGFMLQTISKIISPIWGIILTALIFAAVHFEFQSIAPLIILSLVLNILYVKTRSIWPGIVFHILNNTIAFIVVLFGIVV
jgi:membrane protease YdiL (CAAX protease family)